MSSPETIQHELEKFTGGIRPQAFRRLVQLAMFLYSVVRPKDTNWREWFHNELTVAVIQKQLGCSERTAWDYLQTLRKLATILP